MWSPTHIQVTVQRAKGLLTKGKNGTNNCFVTINVGKEKYQTSVKDKADANVNWNEECELKIPDQGNRAELVLTCLHRNNLGIDEFLGQATLPLNEMDVYDRPRSKWFKLESKPGKEKKSKERGELEARISFIVKSGSLTDLSKKDKHKSSIGQLASSVGGSLLSIGTIEKRKGIKKFAKSLGSKMHLHSKKKNKEGDDVSFSGSFASIGTPTSTHAGSRAYGQRAGEADPGVISEDEDEFVFDNLSHKSSGSSLNIRSGLQPPTQKSAPRNPSPLLTVPLAKAGGKQQPKREVATEEDLVIDPDLEEIENDYSIRARTLPAPSKPPRTPQLGTESVTQVVNAPVEKEQTLNEWETKLYGKHLEVGRGGNSDSLKRRSWEPERVPLPTANEEAYEEVILDKKEEIKAEPKADIASTDSDSSSSDSEVEEMKIDLSEPVKLEKKPQLKDTPTKPQELIVDTSPKLATHNNLLSPEVDHNDFDQFNASFAKYEQNYGDKIYGPDAVKKWSSSALIAQESQAPTIPQAMPRNRSNELELKKAQEEEEARQRQAAIAAAAEAKAAAELKRREEEEAKERKKAEAEKIRRAAEDAKLEEELRLNEQRLREEEAALQEELHQQEEQKRREAKRVEEDQRILNFVKRSTSVEEDGDQSFGTPEQSPKEWDRTVEMREKRMGKYKYLNKRENGSNSPSPKSNERIIIGHERASTHSERRSEISVALTKKYEGKSREELMLIANGMETEALLQRQRVKELEDYLDNLLLRVMETHPKILQNPYARTTSAKSG